MSFKITCPTCQSTLRSEKPIPLGKAITCPKCRNPIATASAAPQFGIQTSPAPVSPSYQPAHGAYQHGAPPAAVAYRPYGPPAAAAVPDISTPRSNKATRALIVGGIFLTLVGVGAGSLFFILGSSSSAPAKPGAAAANGQPFNEAEERERIEKILKEVNNREVKPLIVLTADEDKSVQDMTKKAVEWVRKQQHRSGFWESAGGSKVDVNTIGKTAMAALTLLECGVPRDDPAIVKALAAMRPFLPQLTHTYSLSLMVLLLEKLNDPEDKDMLEQMALRLMAGQRPRGGWFYNVPVLNEDEHRAFKEVLLAMKLSSREQFVRDHKALMDRLPPRLQTLGCLGTISERPDDYKVNDGDNSNTQFAMLALWAARRQGVPAERSLRLVANHFRFTQNPSGTWAYHYPNSVASQRPTMTCAGLVGMAIHYGLKDNPGASVRNDPQILKGLSVISNAQKRGGQFEMYYLWSVERVAVLFQLNKIDDLDWYRWGMGILQPKQAADGHWSIGCGPGASPLVDTLFALLFLQRVNLAQDLTDKIRDDVPWVIPDVAAKE